MSWIVASQVSSSEQQYNDVCVMCTSCAKENVAAVCYYIHWHTNRRSPRTHQNIGCKCTFATNKDRGGPGASMQAAIENNIIMIMNAEKSSILNFNFLLAIIILGWTLKLLKKVGSWMKILAGRKLNKMMKTWSLCPHHSSLRIFYRRKWLTQT